MNVCIWGIENAGGGNVSIWGIENAGGVLGECWGRGKKGLIMDCDLLETITWDFFSSS